LKIELLVDGRKIPMNDFVQKIVGNVIQAMVETLHTIDSRWKEISTCFKIVSSSKAFPGQRNAVVIRNAETTFQPVIDGLLQPAIHTMDDNCLTGKLLHSNLFIGPARQAGMPGTGPYLAGPATSRHPRSARRAGKPSRGSRSVPSLRTGYNRCAGRCVPRRT